MVQIRIYKTGIYCRTFRLWGTELVNKYIKKYKNYKIVIKVKGQIIKPLKYFNKSFEQVSDGNLVDIYLSKTKKKQNPKLKQLKIDIFTLKYQKSMKSS